MTPNQDSSSDQPRPEDHLPSEDFAPVEEDHGADEEGPRRSASAEFVVQSSAGSDVMLREAMDPANQSLREALRLSFRVLQVVILLLVVLFIFSGFKTVATGQSGVMLRWGSIVEVGGRKALEPGLQFSWWPYPAGEFILFQDSDRKVAITQKYWPIPVGQPVDQAIANAQTTEFLRPGQRGLLLTIGSDIAHAQFTADYDVVDPVQFIRTIENTHPDPDRLDADRLVELAVQRAAVHTAARNSLQEFVAYSGVIKEDMERGAQDVLDRVGAGIQINAIGTPVEPKVAFAIEKAFRDVQSAEIQAQELVVRANQERESTLSALAGANAITIMELIAQYENALDLENGERAAELADAINVALESPQTSGEVVAILSRARAYRSIIESTLGAEVKHLKSLLPTFEQNPRLVVVPLWEEALAYVLSREDTETFYMPASIRQLQLALEGNPEVREVRRKNRMDEEKQRSFRENFGNYGGYRPYMEDLERRLEGKPGRRLDPQGRGLRSKE